MQQDSILVTVEQRAGMRMDKIFTVSAAGEHHRGRRQGTPGKNVALFLFLVHFITRPPYYLGESILLNGHVNGYLAKITILRTSKAQNIFPRNGLID